MPYLSAREFAELQRILRQREKKRVRPVAVRPPKASIRLAKRRGSSKRVTAGIV